MIKTDVRHEAANQHEAVHPHGVTELVDLGILTISRPATN